jgi:hypothetical protein
MNDITSELLEAHIAHELKLFNEEEFQKTIETWVNSTWENLSDIITDEWLSVDHIMVYIQKYVQDWPISAGITEIAGECSRQFLSNPIHSKTKLSDIFPHDLWDYIVEKNANKDSVLQKEAHKIINSTVFSKMLSDALYYGIRSYILEENVVMKTFPPIASILKRGKKVVIGALPNLEGNIENNIKKFIEENLESSISRSEKYLMRYSEKLIQGYGDEIWEGVFTKPITEHIKSVNDEDMEDYIIFGLDFWQNFRKTEFFYETSREAVQIIFDKYKDFSVPEMLTDLGISKKIITEEGFRSCAPLIKKLMDSGKLENMIRTHLESFYHSDAAEKILQFPK